MHVPSLKWRKHRPTFINPPTGCLKITHHIFPVFANQYGEAINKWCKTEYFISLYALGVDIDNTEHLVKEFAPTNPFKGETVIDLVAY